MRILFLDINGVLNSTAFYRRRGVLRGGGIASLIDPDTITRLNRLLDATGAQIVLTSTWRRGDLFEKVKDAFRIHGVHGAIIDATPDLFHLRNLTPQWRGAEIQLWLHTHAADAPHVIIDDGDDMGPLVSRLVQTDHTIGLQETDVDRAIALFEASSEK